MKNMYTVLAFVTISTVYQHVAGVYVNDFDQKLDFKCPQDNQVISRVKSIHDNGAEDRRFEFECRDIGTGTTAGTASCVWSVNWENALDLPVEFKCHSNGYINGMISEHDNGAEDRRWKFYCCSIPDIHTYDCDLTGWTNDFDKPQDYQLPVGKVMTGSFSEHDSGPEDRRYRYEICNTIRFNNEGQIVG